METSTPKFAAAVIAQKLGIPFGMPSPSLVGMLQDRARVEPDRLAYQFVREARARPEAISYKDLDERARAIAAEIQQYYRPGTHALLLYPPSLDFVSAFFG